VLIARRGPRTITRPDARLFPLHLSALRNKKGLSPRATITHQQWWSDGMSDYDDAFQVRLTDDENFYGGCCRITR
jgi:hypothetical protein